MTDDFEDLCRSARIYFTIYPLKKVETTSDKLPSPAFIPNAMVPKRLASERRVGERGVTHETLRGVGIKSQEERDKQVVCVPECLVRLLSNFNVGGCEHHQHTEQHDVPCDTSRLSIVYLNCALRPYLMPLNIEKAIQRISEGKKRLHGSTYLT